MCPARISRRRFYATVSLVSCGCMAVLLACAATSSCRQFGYKGGRITVGMAMYRVIIVCWEDESADSELTTGFFVDDVSSARFTDGGAWLPVYIRATVGFRAYVIPVWMGIAFRAMSSVICALMWRRFKARLKVATLYCIGCGYCLLGNTSGCCPECGERVPTRACAR